jgi:hypothetical protein
MEVPVVADNVPPPVNAQLMVPLALVSVAVRSTGPDSMVTFAAEGETVRSAVLMAMRAWADAVPAVAVRVAAFAPIVVGGT